MRVYLDNAATTALDSKVIEAMMPYFIENYGNPSSLYAEGRKAKAAIETSRKTVADLFNVNPAEIFFTAGGTESDNIAMKGAIETYKYTNLITSPLEHHAVLHTVDFIKSRGVNIHYLEVNELGEVNLDQLEYLLSKNNKSLVSLMHANNEIGNITDIDKVGELTKEYNGFFHTDAVQSIGHYEVNLSQGQISSLAASAHKIHGPKGTGLLYVNKNNKIQSLIHGGAQERNMRAGTENVAGIVGFAKALEIAFSQQEIHENHLRDIKNYMKVKLSEICSDISYNGNTEAHNSLSTVLNTNIPMSLDAAMLLFQLDLKGVSASGGSACSSGALSGSHVISAIGRKENVTPIRFSFSRFTNNDEIDYTIKVLSEIISK